MTRVRRTSVQCKTFDIGHGIGSETRWALANGLVIVGNAYSSSATGAPVADVATSVTEAVAELSRWTVDIVDARDALATHNWIVRITGVQSRRAFAVGHMVVRDAEGARSTGHEIAKRLTGENAFGVGLARAVFRTVGFQSALIFPPSLTAEPVVGVSRVTREALAPRFVVDRDALGVGGAGEAFADGMALQNAERVRVAGGDGRTVLVDHALGHGWFLASRQYRVPFVAIEALAAGAARVVDLTLLVRAAGYLAAGVDALATPSLAV